MKRIATGLIVFLAAAALTACGPEEPVEAVKTSTPTTTATATSKPITEPTATPVAPPETPTPKTVPRPKPTLKKADPNVGNLLPKMTGSAADKAFVEELAKIDPSAEPRAGKFIAQRGCKMMDQGTSPEKTFRALKETKALNSSQTQAAFAVGTVVYCPSHMGDVLNYARTL